MKYKWLVCVVVLFFFLQPSIGLATDAKITELDKIANNVLQLTEAKRYGEAKKALEQFEGKLTKHLESTHFTNFDELRILQLAYSDVDKKLSADNIDHSLVVNSATKFRLVMDAIYTNHEPLWTNMEGTVMAAFQTLKTTVMTGETDYYHERLNSFLLAYDIIYPSIMLDANKEQFQKVDAQIQFLQHYAKEMLASDEVLNELEALETNLLSIFDNVQEDEADPSLWWVIISTGGIIIATLSYVGFKKYKADEQKKRYEKKQKH
ncbi:sporulation protein YpjB [Bacillus kwashiorkori]|uniref:sporulation protein YpjB n=1 Tax=Bacillus kwashiorkori TaxID=1522318 RepID=UPI000783B0E0|nr:sporulation protein YpjB [Bacillus kwashiorkori]